MALKKLLADLSIISKLGTNPGVDDGLSEEQLKAKFDEAANIIKDYLNNYLILQIENVVDVDALLADILDVTLSKTDKAANAAATGEAIRGLRSFFEKVVHGGDYVLESDGSLAAEISGSATIRVKGGEGVMQGNLFALNIGAYEDVELLDGTYGLYRNDLIVVRCTKDEANALSYALVGLTGTNTSGEPVDPEYTQSDINADGTVRDFPLYRIKFDGVDIVKVEALFEAEKPMIIESVGKAKEYTNTLVRPNLLDNWYFLNPVNQRNSEDWDYPIDRWILNSGSAEITNNGILLNGTMVQTLENAVGQTVKASVLTTDGLIDATYDDSTRKFHITASGATLIAAKLELGDTQTLAHQDTDGTWLLNEIPNFSEQLARCQRYFMRYFSEADSTYIGLAMGNSAQTYAYMPFALPVAMRTVPSVVANQLNNSAALALYAPGITIPVTAVSASACDESRDGCKVVRLGFKVADSAVEAGKVYWVRIGDTSLLDFTADL